MPGSPDNSDGVIPGFPDTSISGSVIGGFPGDTSGAGSVISGSPLGDEDAE